MAAKVGQPAPDFKAQGTGGEVTLAGLKGKWVVLYFYPKSFTPGCTKESCSLRDGHEGLTGLNAVVLGASIDDLETQKKFKAEYKLPFDLLADSDKSLARAFDVLAPLGLFAARRTFILDPAGAIAHVFDSVSVGTHADDVKAELTRLQAAAKPR
ncbi:MAG: peroxiredoxin [Lentisphaerae bacterium]|nr:peroxiredoxin [Lentisphaerota bacterium]